MSSLLERPWHRRKKLDLRSIFRGGVDGAIYQPADPAALLTRRNLFTESEFRNGVTDAPTRSGLVSATTLTGYAGAIAFGYDGATASYAYKSNVTSVIGVTYALSVVVEMTDGLAPVFGSATDTSALNDFGITGANNRNNPTTYIVEALGGAAYRVTSVFVAAAASTNNGVLKHSTNSSRTFKVTGFQIERASSRSEYQPVTDWTTEYLADSRHDRIVQWQESTGVTPVTVTETACGLRLDERFTGIRGAELSTYSAGFPNTTGITTTASTVALVGSALEVTGTSGAGNNYAVVPMASGLTVGRTYEVRMRVRRGAQGVQQGVNVFTFATITARAVTNSGTFTEISWRVVATATSGTGRVYASDAAGAIGDSVLVESISVREVPGNHTLQATSAARPVVSQRVNQLISTEALGAAAWIDSGATVGAAITDPNGGTTAVAYTRATSAGDGRYQAITACVPGVNVFRCKVKAGTSPTSLITFYDATAVANRLSVDITWTAGVPSAVAGTGSVSAPLSLGNGWYEYVMTTTSGVVTANTNRVYFYPARTGSSNGQTAYMWGVDLRSADDAAKSIPAYQYVNTATDMATDGFPAYEKFDGTDDSRTSATGGGSTTGFFWCGVVTVLGGAAAIRVLLSDWPGATGGFRLALSSGNTLYLGVFNGGSEVFASSASTVGVGETAVLTAWYDGDKAYVQVNNGTVAASASGVLAAGQSSFTEGRYHYAAANYFNGRMYGRVYAKNYSPSANLRERIKRELAQRAGCLHLLN